MPPFGQKQGIPGLFHVSHWPSRARYIDSAHPWTVGLAEVFHAVGTKTEAATL